MISLRTKTSQSTHEIAESQGNLKNRVGKITPIPIFDLNKSTLDSSLIFNIDPAICLMKEGWIIDGRFIIYDSGVFVGEGAHWSLNSIRSQLVENQKKIKPSSRHLLKVEGLFEQPIFRDIDDDELENTVFLGGFNNLSHWMMEICPKIPSLMEACERWGNFKTVATTDEIPEKWMQFTIKCGKTFFGDKSALETKFISSTKAVRCKNIVFISSGLFRGRDYAYRGSLNQIKSYRNQLIKFATGAKKNQKPYVLYLSRKNASHRRVINQNDLIDTAQKIFKSYTILVEDNIQKLSMQDQAILINHATLVVEEGGGSTGFTSNLINRFVPYVIIAPGERTNGTSQTHIGSLERCAAWVFGESIGEKKDLSTIDNDMLVSRENFSVLLVKMSSLLNDKQFFPTLVEWKGSM